MNLFAAITIMIAWCSLLNSPTQTPSVVEKQLLLEKRAMADTQRILSSKLDAELPRLPFADWIRKVVGPGVGVVWQLSECGDRSDASPALAGEMRACVEVNAVLPDERKVVVMIMVGTFNKGITGPPAFLYGVIEQRQGLYTVQQLRDLPKLLWEPGSLVNRSAVKLPVVDMPKVRLAVNDAYAANLPVWSGGKLGQPMTIEAPPQPAPLEVKPQALIAPSPAKNQEVSEAPGRTATSGAPKLLGAVSL